MHSVCSREQLAPQADAQTGTSATLPDAGCLEAGDQHLHRALLSYAASGVSDCAIAARLRYRVHVIANDLCPATAPHFAAEAVAEHCAASGMSFREIIGVQAWLAANVLGWPDDAYEMTAVVRDAIAEFAA